MDAKENLPGQSPPEAPQPAPGQSWTYPTRTCRLCLEDVSATVTLYPPGLPPAFQRPLIEYKNDDEYGRLIKPCRCRGGMRYIHELCLRRSRTETARPGSLWKCHECGYQFNLQRLAVERYLRSRAASAVLTVLVMLLVMFLLGFVADPILNVYTDPYEAIVGHEDVWRGVDVNKSQSRYSGWAQHFLKGLVSMGVLSFFRTLLLNPFQWWNLRNTGMLTGRISGRAVTGRDRAVNVSWIVILVGMLSAAWLFYQWVQEIIGRTLQCVGNNIVDTQLPGDDDDLKPPTNFRFAESYPDIINAQGGDSVDTRTGDDPSRSQPDQAADPKMTSTLPPTEVEKEPRLTRRSVGEDSNDEDSSGSRTLDSRGYTSALDEVQDQEWSFELL